MQLKKICLFGALTLSSSLSYAMLCPGNFNTISPGDTIATVEQKCGKPASQQASETSSNVPQEWNYFVKLTPTNPATIRTSVAFAGGKVINISVNNVGLTNTSVCGATIKIGDTQDKVKGACGKPAFISQNNGPTNEIQKMDAPAKNADYTYQNGMSSTTLHFENGLLVDSSSGSGSNNSGNSNTTNKGSNTGTTSSTTSTTSTTTTTQSNTTDNK